MTPFQVLALIALGGLAFADAMVLARNWVQPGWSLLRPVVWLLAAFAVAYPDSVTWLAVQVGIRRGADLVLYLTCLAFVYVGFKLYSQGLAFERKIAQLARQQAIAGATKGGQISEVIQPHEQNSIRPLAATVEEGVDDTPLVSVVMAAFRPNPAFLAAAVESVLGQTLTRWEFIIVEKPSELQAGPLLDRYADPRIKHVVTSEGATLVEQRNMALSLARSEYVAVLDADDVCEPRRLEEQYRRLRSDPEITVLGSQIRVIDECDQVVGYRRYPCDPAHVEQTLPRWNPLAQSAVMYRRSAVLAAGGYQYTHFPATEDYELWSRLAVAGARLANLPEPLVRYRIHTSSLKSNHVHGILRGTLEIKRAYWRAKMGPKATIRYWLEHAMLLVPDGLVLAMHRSLSFRA